MATVTGFTAERMLEIEAASVIDGEVRTNNLFLITRGGTEIDAGNVRGPIGNTGPPVADGNKGDITVSATGTNWQINADAVTNAEMADMAANRIKGAVVAGNPVDLTPAQVNTLLSAVTAVNDQNNAAVYAPRIFANKAALDAWASPPRGAMGVTIDTDTVWVRGAVSWFVVYGIGTRQFPSVTIPSGQTDAGAATPTDWLATNVSIPTWATKVVVQTGVVGIYEATGPELPYTLTTRVGVNSGFTAGGTGKGINMRFTDSWGDVINTPSTGTINIAIKASRSSGGTLRFDAACRATFDCIFLS